MEHLMMCLCILFYMLSASLCWKFVYYEVFPKILAKSFIRWMINHIGWSGCLSYVALEVGQCLKLFLTKFKLRLTESLVSIYTCETIYMVNQMVWAIKPKL